MSTRRTAETNWDALIDAHLVRLRVERGLSTHSLEAYSRDLRSFHDFCRVHRIEPPQFDGGALTRYLESLADRGFAPTSQRRHLSAVRGLAREMLDRGVINRDPLLSGKLTNLSRKLPRTLSRRDIEMLLETIDTSTVRGLRDRAMLELAYSSGLRVSELVGVQLPHLNLRAGLVTVPGKGGKERMIPLGRSAASAIAEYLKRREEELRCAATNRTPRAALKSAPRSRALFISRLGGPMTRQGFFKALKAWAAADRRLSWMSPHTLRHSFATHLLEQNIDIRVIQVLLGHSKLETTALYTRVATNTIREVMSPLDRLTPLWPKKDEIKNETKQETKAEPPT